MINNFKDIDSLSPGDFEIFVRDLFELSGWTNLIITQVGKEYRHGDGGVDIFAYRAGRRFAIEVKQRDISTTVDVKALNQLVTGARLANVTNMILVTNSYFTSEVIVRALRLGVELIDRDELQNLWVKRHSEIGRDIKPRKYQSSVINEAITQYRKGKNKVLIEMATGLGKTYTVALLIKELIQELNTPPRILFIAHQVEILLQSVTSFKNVLGIGSYTFSACFDGSDPEDTDFVFATFDTLYGKLESLSNAAFDFIIVDEAHHTPANTYAEVVKYFSPKLLIGLTATPYRSDNRSVTDFFGGRDGHIGKYDLVWGLKHKKLAFPKYLVLLDDLDQGRISQLDSGLSLTDLDKRLFLHKKDQEVVRVIEKTVEEKKIENVKGIVFCRSIRHMRHLIGFFKIGSATLVHSRMKDQERRENIRSFREGGCKYILVCDLFNEGVDIPETNILIFMRYTGSKTIWLQQLGRGLRKTPNKEYVHVLDFIGSLDRLNEVRELTNQVRAQKLDRDEWDYRDEHFHDNSIEVSYNESAAKVLELIENLKYRLNSREVLINKLASYFDVKHSLPDINQIEMELNDVSLDQISTHFDSYAGYIRAVFGEIDLLSSKSKVLDFYQEYFTKYGVFPSKKAIALQFSCGGLLEFTESEIAGFIGPEAIVVRNESLPRFAEPFKSPVIEDDFEYCNLYLNTIFTRADFKKLSDQQLGEIKDKFGSSTAFLMELNKRRNG